MRKLILPCALALSIAIGIFRLIAPARAAATITVTTTSDVIANDGLCSLREAVIAANTDSPFNDCPTGSGADTINFSPSLPSPATFVLTKIGTNEDGASSGDLDILGSLTIQGNGSAYTILDGNASDRVFDIRPGAHATVSGVTVRNGNPAGSGEGGGIRVLGALTLTNSTIADNQGGGLYNNGGGVILAAVNITGNTGGYGLRNLNQATLTFNGGAVEGNQGGGIYNATSTANLSNLNITGNRGGGGLYNTGATLSHLSLINSTVISNTATNGGGIYNEGVGAIANVNNSSILGNTADVSGGGVFNNGILSLNGSTLSLNHARSGGGIDHFGGTMGLMNDTISVNSASDNGGGLYNRSDVTLTNVTLNSNTANGPGTGGNIFIDTSQLTIQNTIVANSDADGNCFNSGGFIHDLGHNLDSADTCGFSVPLGDLINTSPLLGPLQANGGPTITHSLLTSSPAIDHGTNAVCPSIDQRGASRPVDGDGVAGAVCDIGAFEVANSAPIQTKQYLPSIFR